MMDAFAPRRRRGVELLDDPGADDALATRSLRDVALANKFFGGTAAVLREIELACLDAPQEMTLLDIGTGAGDIPERARALAARCGVRLTTTGLERTYAVAAAARLRATRVCVGDALAIPFRDNSFDLVTCSQVLHHFESPDDLTILREMSRIARRRVIVSDLRRSWAAAAGIWASSFALGFHPVSRHDGVLSVLRGYRRAELAALVERAVGVAPRAHDRPGFRVTVAWTPA